MIISYIKSPDISKYMQFIQTAQISSDLSLILIYKRAFRGNDVILDIYRDEISEKTKIISGRKLTADSLVCLPKTEIGFNFYIHCVDVDNIKQPIKNNNLHRFYLQFTSYEDGKIWSTSGIETS